MMDAWGEKFVASGEKFVEGNEKFIAGLTDQTHALWHFGSYKISLFTKKTSGVNRGRLKERAVSREPESPSANWRRRRERVSNRRFYARNVERAVSLLKTSARSGRRAPSSCTVRPCRGPCRRPSRSRPAVRCRVRESQRGGFPTCRRFHRHP